MPIAELFKINRNKNPFPVYKTDILAEEKGHTCLRLCWPLRAKSHRTGVGASQGHNDGQPT